MRHAASGLTQPLPWICSGKRANVIIGRSHADPDKPLEHCGDSRERNDGFRRLRSAENSGWPWPSTTA